MSLINDMLKDLDGNPAGRRPVRRTAAPAAPVPWRTWLLPGLAVLCVLYWVLFEWNVLGFVPDSSQNLPVVESVPMDSGWLDQLQQAEAILAARKRESAIASQTDTGTNTGTSTAMANPATTAVINPRESDKTPIPGTQESSAAATTLTAAVSNQPNSFNSMPGTDTFEMDDAVVRRLLQSAEQALAVDRLTVPESNNAFYFYSTILLADPANKDALQGIEQVKQRYLALIDGAISRNEPDLARRYLDGAARAGLDSQILEQRRSGLGSPANDGSEAALQRVATGSPQRTDRNLARALQQKGLTGREQQALQWVTDGAPVTHTVLALTGLYSDMGATVRLQNLQRILASRQMDLQVLPAAHMHWLARDADLAIRRLQEVQFDDAAEVARLRLLAGLLQETGAFEAASDTYAKLVDLPGATSHDWLGLAVSLDAQNRHHAAYQAYQNLAGQQMPSPDIANFIQQRLSDLALTRHR